MSLIVFDRFVSFYFSRSFMIFLDRFLTISWSFLTVFDRSWLNLIEFDFFLLYSIVHDRSWLIKSWKKFQKIENHLFFFFRHANWNGNFLSIKNNHKRSIKVKNSQLRSNLIKNDQKRSKTVKKRSETIMNDREK